MPLPVTAVAARWTVMPGSYGALTLVEDATILVQGTQVLDVVTGAGDVTADRRIDAPRGIALPGFVNLHNHAVNGPIFRGVIDDIAHQADDDSLVQSLLLPLGDHAAKILSEDEIRAVYRLAVMEILRTGTTTVLDMPRLAHTAFFAVAKEMGLRVFGAPYLFSAAGDERAVRDTLRVADEHEDGPGGLVRVGFGPHATDTCSPELLRRVAHEARERDTFVSIHVAQSRGEVARVRERHGCTPVEYLRETGVIGPRVVAAHCVFTEDSDLDVLRDSGSSVAHCPLTFARGGITVSFERFQRHGVRTGIGTDAYSFDHFAELRAAGFIAKLTSGESGAGSAPSLLHAATIAGADALGESRLGRLQRGCLADLVVVDLGGAHVQPVHDPVKNVVWNATPADVALVMVNGEVVVERGDVRGCRESSVVDAAAAAVEKLWSSAEREGLLARTEGSPDGRTAFRQGTAAQAAP